MIKRLWLTILLLAVVTLIACREGQLDDNSSTTDTTSVITYRLPGGEREAQLADGVLSLREPDGSSQVLLEEGQINGAGWFASGEALAFTTALGDGSYHLGVVDVATGASQTVQTFSEPVEEPHVSGSGRFLSLLVGSGAKDGCRIDTRLQVLVLDAQHDLVAAYDWADFNGAAVDEAYPLYPIANGQWVDGSTLSVWMDSACPVEADKAGAPLPGGYLLNAAFLQAQRLDSSP